MTCIIINRFVHPDLITNHSCYKLQQMSASGGGLSGDSVAATLLSTTTSSTSIWTLTTAPVAEKGGVLFTSLQSIDGKSRVDVCHFGATITSWVCDSNECLYLSDKAIFDNKKAIRGGVPLVFPQFGQKNKAMASHGFARNKTWALSPLVVENADYIEVLFTLSDDSSTFEVFPFHFDLEYRVRLYSSNRLEYSLTCNNVSDSSDAVMQLTMLLHTYLRVQDISKTAVSGFKDKDYLESLGKPPAVAHEDRERINFKEEVDRIYHNMNEGDSVAISSDEVEGTGSRGRTVISRASASIADLDSSFPSSSSSPSSLGREDSKPLDHIDVVLWNPWILKTSTMADMPSDGYQNFVCVEPGIVKDWFELRPRTSVTLTQTLTFE